MNRNLNRCVSGLAWGKGSPQYLWLKPSFHLISISTRPDFNTQFKLYPSLRAKAYHNCVSHLSFNLIIWINIYSFLYILGCGGWEKRSLNCHEGWFLVQLPAIAIAWDQHQYQTQKQWVPNSIFLLLAVRIKFCVERAEGLFITRRNVGQA